MKILKYVSRCHLLSFCGFLISFSSLSVPRNPCQGAPCKGGSSCVTLNDTHICLCTLGYYYNSSTCKKGVLQGMNPAELHFRPKVEQKMQSNVKKEPPEW